MAVTQTPALAVSARLRHTETKKAARTAAFLGSRHGLLRSLPPLRC
jgi:hypothetical protein